MPKDTSARTPSRWEGTQTYPRANPSRRRTVAQVHEDMAERLRADREKRRIGVEKLRRNSIAALPTKTPETTTEAEEEVFFDATEESMPGSNKKKRQASGSAASAVGADQTGTPSTEHSVPGRSGVDPDMLALLMSIKKDISDTTRSAVDKIDQRIDENAKAIQKVGEDTTMEVRKLRQHCEESQAKFEEKIEKQLDIRDQKIERRLLTLEAKSPAISSRVVTQTSKQDEAYHSVRRTLKLWPVRGDDLEDALKVFLGTNLKISKERIESLGKIIVKPAFGKIARDRHEVLATFECCEDRDFTKSMGINLAGLSGLGMSLHVPGHLLDNFYALNSIGYNIKKNQEGVKRSIKFDDSVQDIYLDIFIGGQWKRILPSQARSALKSAPAAAGSASGSGISASDLISLVQGEAFPGITDLSLWIKARSQPTNLNSKPDSQVETRGRIRIFQTIKLN